MKTKRWIIALGVPLLIIIIVFIVLRLESAENGTVPDTSSDQTGATSSVSSEPEKMTVKVFFNNSKLDPEVSCNKVFSVDREVDKTPAVARAALTELLKGTTPSEEEAGFMTSLNPDVKIQSLAIENGVAKVDFDEQLEAAVGGSCRVSAISAQIRETLQQFPSVTSVIISINGRTEDILQP